MDSSKSGSWLGGLVVGLLCAGCGTLYDIRGAVEEEGGGKRILGGLRRDNDVIFHPGDRCECLLAVADWPISVATDAALLPITTLAQWEYKLGVAYERQEKDSAPQAKP